MGYTNRTLVERTLANTLTSASPASLGTPVDLIRIGNTLDFNVVDDAVVDQYIQWADEEINSAISELYVTPIDRQSDYETTLLSDINVYNDFIITTDAAPFDIGDTVILTNGVNTEMHTIAAILDDVTQNIFQTYTPISFGFLASNTRVVRVKYSDPITLMSSRLSAANVYEKYFMAEASPSQSEYGKWLRGLVSADINNILNGRTILHGQHRIGRRFYNPTLRDQYSLPLNKGNNDMDHPT